MKKYIILIGIVAWMSSCNDDMYDNIKELVDSETVYPAGYDLQNVKLRSGDKRVEIDLCETREAEPYLPRAVKTVVEFGDTIVEFKPARSWVNIDGLTVPQVYHFTIYTVDEFGNKSAPVKISGKPFTEADNSTLVIAGLAYTANTTQAIVTWNLAPTVFTVVRVKYSYTDDNGVQTGNMEGNRLVFNDLPTGETTSVDLSFEVLPAGAIDTVSLSHNIKITTMSAAELDAYLNLSRPFLIADSILTSSAPFIIKAADFDLGGEGKAYHKILVSGSNTTYRPSGGDVGLTFGIDDNASSLGLVGITATSVGDWYAYTVIVQNPGLYKLEYCRAINANGGQAILTLDNLDVLGIIPITNNNNAAMYSWADPNLSIRLSAGRHKFRWTLRGAAHNFGGLRFTYVEP